MERRAGPDFVVFLVAVVVRENCLAPAAPSTVTLATPRAGQASVNRNPRRGIKKFSCAASRFFAQSNVPAHCPFRAGPFLSRGSRFRTSWEERIRFKLETPWKGIFCKAKVPFPSIPPDSRIPKTPPNEKSRNDKDCQLLWTMSSEHQNSLNITRSAWAGDKGDKARILAPIFLREQFVGGW